MNLKIRGIYSTALTKFFKDEGFEVANLSDVMAGRFESNNNCTANTLVYDKEDSNGIVVSGSSSEKAIEKLREKFLDIVVRKTETGSIYSGIIKRVDKDVKQIIIDIGDEEGILGLENYWGFVREKEKVLVQVKGVARGKKILTTKLRIFGENCIIIKDGFQKVSHYINSEDERKKLEKLSEEAKKNGWGVLWKALAEGKTEEDLRNEINELIREEKKIRETFERSNKPGHLSNGDKVYYVDFGALTKKELDKIRKNILNTIPGHHFLKSGNYSMIVDFAEMFDIDSDIITQKINKVLKQNGPSPGRYYEIIHKKPRGKEIVLRGTVVESDDDKITIKRNLRSTGRLDGIGTQINPGDFAVTEFSPNDWKIIHRYFDKNGFPKGVYISINTPIEVYPDFARYIDLEIDVIEKENKREIIDVENLEFAMKSGLMHENLAKKAIEVANNLIKEELK